MKKTIIWTIVLAVITFGLYIIWVTYQEYKKMSYENNKPSGK